VITRAFLISILVAGALAVGAAQDRGPWSTRLEEGFAQLTAGKLDEAQAIFDSVAALARDAHDDRSLGEARRGQGRVFQARGNAAARDAAYQDALAIFESSGDAKGSGQVRSDMGYAAWQKADYGNARKLYEEAAGIFERAGLKTDQASALRNMTFGNMPLAERITTLERAFAIAVESPDRRLEGLILHQLGDSMSGKGDQQAALEYYERALPLLERPGDPASLARLLTSFGRLHRIHGDASVAIGYYERALELVRGGTDRDAERQLEDALAIAFGALHQPREALAHAERSLAIAREARPALVKVAQLRVGEFAVRTGDVDRAIELLSEPQASPGNEASRHSSMALVLAQRGNADAALIEANQAIAVSETLDWEYKIRAYNARSVAHEQAGRLIEAAADATTAVTILDGIRGSLVTSDAFRAAFSDGYREFFDRAVTLNERIERHDEAYRIAETGRARALRDLIDNKDRAPEAATSAPIADGDALVAYWVTRSATYAWVVTSRGVVLSKRIDVTRTALDSMVTDSQSLSTAVATVRGDQPSAVFEKDPRPALRAIHDHIVAPLRASFGSARRLLIVPDGPLLGMSFAELIDAKGRYLLEDYTLQYAPSARLLARRARTAATESALLVSVSSGFPKAIGVSLGPLPAASKEVDLISTLFRTGATRISEGDATESNIRNVIGRRRVIHFATHAVASNAHPADSFLALRAGGGQDGRLTAAEIAALPIDADLVVLSACRGAAGRVSGEGMLGLSRAWLGAGAHSLLASVRELPDEAAADMLPAFYRSWRTSGDAAEALRAAQLSRLKRLRSGQVKMTTPFGAITMPEHPSLWSGLVLIGER
jgi:CHAT domain-containing protein/tetratricopeptide (TPR) repeat protein